MSQGASDQSSKAEKKEAVAEQDKHENTVQGGFKRSATEFHDLITAEADSKYPAEKDRYHLYYSTACPWCHRVLMLIALKGLGHVISSSNVDPHLANLGKDNYIGWLFNDKYPDHLHKDSKSVWDVYKIHDANYPRKKLTVPILFDKKTQKIVNNESAEIIKFLNSAFNKFAKYPQLDLNPDDEKVQESMKKWDDLIYPAVNDGVYRCGFAKSQEAYDDAFGKLFAALDAMEAHLQSHRYLCGDVFTLSDVRAWVTLIRFDAVYFTHFKCNLKMIKHDYPNIWAYTREIYQMNAVKDTVDMTYTKETYYRSMTMCNPLGIIAKGPVIDFDEPHGRDKHEYSK
mmetsp:Transcript_39388/g.62969  ORF Transcript_39388/g.62969 Transcript_39388/m.62969 type:complete len:342 (-) Transcript_39388:104-1129(-)